jgi:predicted transcriptional regulator
MSREEVDRALDRLRAEQDDMSTALLAPVITQNGRLGAAQTVSRPTRLSTISAGLRAAAAGA